MKPVKKLEFGKIYLQINRCYGVISIYEYCGLGTVNRRVYNPLPSIEGKRFHYSQRDYVKYFELTEDEVHKHIIEYEFFKNI